MGPSSEQPRRFKIEGVDCAEEVAILKREVGPIVGGEELLTFDVLNGVMSVAGLADEAQVARLLEAISRTGMRARLIDSHSSSPSPERSWWARHGRSALTVTSGILTAAAFAIHVILAGGFSQAVGSEGAGHAEAVPLPARVIYSLAIAAGIFFILPKAVFAIRRLRPDMNLLMTVAVLGAIAIGEWFEASTVTFLFALSLTLETWSVGRARRAIEKLMDLTPATVRMITAEGALQEMPPEFVPVGSRFVVRPGERVPLDGEVLDGTSEVNQAPITGESIPILKAPGSSVFAGSVNGQGVLEIRSTRPSGDTTLARIIRLVSEAQQKRSPSEQWVDRFARRYTPAVVMLAIFVIVVPVLVWGQLFDRWLYQALVLLVIACPCALVISTPVSVVAAIAAAARQGVLVKGGAFMEIAGRLKAIAFDKTGTLTAGKPTVVQVSALNGHTETELLERAAALEVHSDHPLAVAILDHASSRSIPIRAAEGVRAVPGKGVYGRWDGREFWLGSHRLLDDLNQETPEVHQQLESLSATGHTVVVVGNQEHVCGFLALADRMRPESAEAVRQLRSLGVDHLVMLTGDNRGTAEAIAKETGMTETEAELLPEEKVAAVERLVSRFQSVAMVGDGINDAPALARASLGIAMGAGGSDTAIETADIALMSDDLSKLPWLIQHSRRMLAIIRANIFLSLLVKSLFVGLTLAGHASLWAAIAADMGVSLLVIANALRLLHEPRLKA
ncbi:MAG: cadmium-translocating P-type ATPase [Acetobacteraceae bacterium]|nr:cadmium-translocating P-type ATPase [Acetobacteraceae bacterium]